MKAGRSRASEIVCYVFCRSLWLHLGASKLKVLDRCSVLQLVTAIVFQIFMQMFRSDDKNYRFCIPWFKRSFLLFSFWDMQNVTSSLVHLICANIFWISEKVNIYGFSVGLMILSPGLSHANQFCMWKQKISVTLQAWDYYDLCWSLMLWASPERYSGALDCV